MNNILLSVQPDIKYLRFQLDQRLTWRTHIKMKRHHLNLKLRGMYWILGRRSKLSLVQMRAQACMDVRYSTLGLCEAVPYTNHPKTAVKNSAVHNQRAAVRL